MTNVPIIGEKSDKPANEDGVIFDEELQVFELTPVAGDAYKVLVIGRKDDRGDYPVLTMEFKGRDGKNNSISLWRDELTAITFALSRQDQQSKLLNAKFREYKEVPVRLVIEAKRDVKKGDMIVAWRKERVPIDFNYTHEKGI